MLIGDRLFTFLPRLQLPAPAHRQRLARILQASGGPPRRRATCQLPEQHLEHSRSPPHQGDRSRGSPLRVSTLGERDSEEGGACAGAAEGGGLPGE